MKRKLQVAVSIVIAVVLVWWLFRGTSWQELTVSIRHTSLTWILFSQIAILVSFITRVQRWSYIVRVTAPVSFRSMFSATQIGFLVNFTLPWRIGEFVRALVLGRLAALSFPKCMAMVALDRVTDMIGLVIVLLVAVLAFRPEQAIVLPAAEFGLEKDILFSVGHVKAAAFGATLILVIGIVVLVGLYVNEKAMLRLVQRSLGLLSARLARQASALLRHFADGLHVFRSAADMAKAVVLSLITWGCFLLTCCCVLNAFSIEWPWYTPFVLVSFTAIATSVAVTPGFVGQFHVAFLGALFIVLPETPKADAIAFAIIGDLVNRIPVTVVGLACLFWEHMGFLELSRQGVGAKTAEEQSG